MTMEQRDDRRNERHAAVDDVLRMLKMYDVEPINNVDDVMVLAEYIRTGEVRHG